MVTPCFGKEQQPWALAAANHCVDQSVKALQALHLLCNMLPVLTAGAPILAHRYATLSAPVLADPILYGDFGNILECLDNADAPQRLYKDVGSYSTVQPLFESLLAAYNAKHKPMQLVFFDDALEHLTRIIRTLRLPMVSAACCCAPLLVGECMAGLACCHASGTGSWVN